MASSTTIKVASQTGAAKDDSFSSTTTGLSEDMLVAKLNVLANDPGAARLYSLEQEPTGTQMPVAMSDLTAMGATITINADGTVQYDASALRGTLQAMAAGESVFDTFTYTVRMANGALSTAKVSVQLNGANDPPQLAAVEAQTISDTAADDQPAAITGQLIATDVDNGAVLHYALIGGVPTGNPHEVQITGDYGTLTLDTQTGAYSFSVNATALNALKAGESVPVSFNVTAVDEFGATSNERVIGFSLVGAADPAEIGGSANGAVQEDGTQAISGNLTVTDRDAGESGFVAPEASALYGQYGHFTFDKDTGDWTYALDNAAANVQALADDEPVTDKLTVSAIDGTAKDIVVSITGANDRPTLDAVGTSFIFDAASDDAPEDISGNLAGHDVDHGAVVSYSFASGGTAVPGTDLVTLSSGYGTLTLDTKTGAYSFEMDAARANELKSGETADTTFSVVAVDEHGAKSDPQSLVFTLVGADDAASITGTFTGTVREDTTLSIGGQLFVSDRDAGQAGFQAVASGLAGTYGSFSFDKDTGVWDYVLNNSAANVQGLNTGDTRTDQLTVKSLDGTEGVLTVSIQGLNETTTDLSVTFTVNRGNAINKQLVIPNFDSNDKLDLVNPLDFVSSTLIDYIKTDANPLDSTQVLVTDRGDFGAVILVGYTTFDPSMQLI